MLEIWKNTVPSTTMTARNARNGPSFHGESAGPDAVAGAPGASPVPTAATPSTSAAAQQVAASATKSSP